MPEKSLVEYPQEVQNQITQLAAQYNENASVKDIIYDLVFVKECTKKKVILNAATAEFNLYLKQEPKGRFGMLHIWQRLEKRYGLSQRSLRAYIYKR